MAMGLLSFTKLIISSFEVIEFAQTFFKQLLVATLSCLFAFVGGMIGFITGAVIGQTTETGFLRGCGVGTLSGSLIALELAESIVNHNFLNKVRVSGGRVDGELITDWLTQVLLKSYDFQVNNMLDQPIMSDLSDIFDVETGIKGLSLEHLNKLPTFKFPSKPEQCGGDDDDGGVPCPICLEELREGECGRKVNGCGHEYHIKCIDTWLVRRGSCPVCRHEIAAA